MKLYAHAVEKPWGRTGLGSVFSALPDQQVGEIWFTHPELVEPPLLVKYIFTSDKLSVQVHPNDDEARVRGLESGKNECWYILEADLDAKLGLGLMSSISKEELRAAALDGSIENLMDWRPVEPGEFLYVPAGTIHAIGAGITLLEIQQNADITYRLFDYGRPRELHLDDAIGVAHRSPYAGLVVRNSDAIDGALVEDDTFSVFRARSNDGIPRPLKSHQRWIMPLSGTASSENDKASAGECLVVQAGADVHLSSDAEVLIAIAGRI